MKLTEHQLRTIVREIVSELFVRPKKRRYSLEKTFSKTHGMGYDDDYLSGDVGFGEFEEGDGDLDDEDSAPGN